MERIHFAGSDRGAKVPVGPIMGPKPGSTFEIDVAAPDKAVTMSRPVKRSKKAIPANDAKYRQTNPMTDSGTSSETALPLYRVMNTP